MKKLLAMLFAAALAATGAGCAEEADVALNNGATLELDQKLECDLDGDGAEERIQLRLQGVEEEKTLSAFVTAADDTVYSYDTDIQWFQGAWVTDLDGDGRMEILISGDLISADYFTWCLHYDPEAGLTPLQFADANRGENTDEYFDSGYGAITAIDGNRLTMVGTQDVLGTWMAARTFTLKDGRFELEDGGLWQMQSWEDEDEMWEYGCLILTKELPVTLSDGSEGTLQKGDKLVITQTDKVSIVYFRTRDGREGSFPIEPNLEEGWGSLVGGAPEYDAFESLPYAD